MVKENYVIKKEIKFDMLLKTFPKIIEMLEINNKKMFNGHESHLKDALNSIVYVFENSSVRYHDAFFIMFALTSNFVEIKNKVDKQELNFSYIADEEFWNKSEIDLNASIFFAYTFLNELYSEELTIDFKELESLVNISDYISLRKKVLNKSTEN